MRYVGSNPTPCTTMTTYEIVEGEHGLGIRCKLCGLTSWNENDVLNFYCGYCHRFHGGTYDQ